MQSLMMKILHYNLLRAPLPIGVVIGPQLAFYEKKGGEGVALYKKATGLALLSNYLNIVFICLGCHALAWHPSLAFASESVAPESRFR